MFHYQAICFLFTLAGTLIRSATFPEQWFRASAVLANQKTLQKIESFKTNKAENYTQ